MRFITSLSPQTIKLLVRIHKESEYYRVRQRAHCIRLSFQGYTTAQLTDIFKVDRITIYNCFNAWEAKGLNGLYDAKGKGRKPKLTPRQKHKVLQWAGKFPKNINRIAALILEEFDLSVSGKTIKRILKECQLTWRRIRRRPKGQPDELEYQQKKEALQQLKVEDEQGIIDLIYFDQSGFCLIPYVPYAWQLKDQTIEVESQKSKRLNVLGFLGLDNNLTAYTFENSITSEVVIACLDDFVLGLKRRTVLVIDNASIHTSKAFEAQKVEWQQKGLELFYLPKYSPQLNLIEILWRFIKYEWIEFTAYLSFRHLVQYVEKVIRNFGHEYKINFV